MALSILSEKLRVLLGPWDLLFIAYLIAISFSPLLPLTGWQGYGPGGEYTHIGEAYRVRYNDPSFGNDKPHLFIIDAGKGVSLLEVSDQESFVNGSNMYRGFSTKTRLAEGGLQAYYNSSELGFVKIVRPLKDSVQVDFISNESMELDLTLWRWYFASIESFDRPVTREIQPKNIIRFRVGEAGRLYEAELHVTPTPLNVSISGEENGGLNKIRLLIVGEKVTLRVKNVSAQQLNAFAILDVSGSRYLYPVIGIGASATYLLFRKKIREYSS